MDAEEQWDDFYEKLTSKSLSSEGEQEYLDFISQHIHEMGSDNSIDECEWCLEGELIIDQILDYKHLHLDPLSEETQSKIVKLICEKYEGVTDDHFWLGTIAQQLTETRHATEAVFETWLGNFEFDYSWVRSDDTNLYESFPEHLIQIAPHSPSTEFLTRAVTAYHGHEFTECDAVPIADCTSCEELLGKVIELKEKSN